MATNDYSVLYFIELDGIRRVNGYSTLDDARFMARPAKESGRLVSIIRVNYANGKRETRFAA